MKNSRKRLLSLMLAMLLVIPMAVSCSGSKSKLSGTWSSGKFDTTWYEEYTFSGKKFTRTSVWWGVVDSDSGSYSLTNDEIEMVFEDGSIWIGDFTRTENTISIDGDRYERSEPINWDKLDNKFTGLVPVPDTP